MNLTQVAACVRVTACAKLFFFEKTGWLGNLDSNQDKQNQKLLCYHYTIGQKKQAGRRAEESRLSAQLEPAMGFEPATACLQNRCSTVELRRRKGNWLRLPTWT